MLAEHEAIADALDGEIEMGDGSEWGEGENGFLVLAFAGEECGVAAIGCGEGGM